MSVTTCLRAPWVLPIAGPPLRDGWVTVARGRVVALGTGRAPDGPGVETRDLGHAVLLPGLINAHTHLELSWLWGKVPPAASLPDWVSNLMGQRFARTGGFTAFIAWSYQPEHTELGLHEATGVDYLRTLALARIVLDNFENLQASWVTQGGKVGQLSLAFGANDMGSVMIEENVVRAAGASYCMDEVEIVRNIENAGFDAKRRNMHYELLGDPIFRERAVPRRLALDVAKAEDDDDRIPDELSAYDARTPAARRLRQQQRDGTITH